MADTSPPNYRRHPRRDVVEWVPKAARRVLDLGCGAGEIGRQLARERGRMVVGVEQDAAAAAVARRLLDEVIEADLEDPELCFAAGRFDCLIYADVLEHLRDPWSVLARQSAWLAEGGAVIVSLPNVRHAAVLGDLLRGRWTYREEGILDRHHLRFFTRTSAIELLEGADYRVERVTPGVLGEFTSRQILLVGRKGRGQAQ